MIRTVWLVGASGVGKSTVGWLLQQALERRGTRAAFVDADQLRNVAGVGAVHGELVADGLRALGPAFASSGAQVLIVVGILDDDEQLAGMLPDAARADLLVVHLHASDETLVRRVQQRRWNVQLAGDSVEYSRAFDRGWVDVTIDTTGLEPAQVVEQLLDRAGAGADSERADGDAGDRLLPHVNAAVSVITGTGGVGISSVGFMTFLQGAHAGERIGYIDSDQLGFVGSDPRSADSADVRARHTIAIAAGMARRGVEHVVMTGDPQTSTAIVDMVRPQHVVWLDASDEAVEQRDRTRAAGGGPPLAGDHRLGLDERGIRAGVAESLAMARDEALRPPGHRLVNTDEASVGEVAERIRATWIAGRPPAESP